MRPRTKGPNDPRLGTLDRQYYCETCEESQNECPGHYGHIELATPVYHIGIAISNLLLSLTSTDLTRFSHEDEEITGDRMPQLFEN